MGRRKNMEGWYHDSGMNHYFSLIQFFTQQECIIAGSERFPHGPFRTFSDAKNHAIKYCRINARIEIDKIKQFKKPPMSNKN